jgi:AcrR family transcriptional regulator
MLINQRPSARQRILSTAADLFYRRGINNTGIDLIIAEAGVAKASLYNHFKSKEEIVIAYLRTLRTGFEAGLAGSVVGKAESYKVPFQLLGVTLVSGEFFGCPFSNAMLELPDSAAVKQEVAAYRDAVLKHFQVAVDGDKVRAAKLMVVYEGAFVNCKLSPNENNVANAIEIAHLVVTAPN